MRKPFLEVLALAVILRVVPADEDMVESDTQVVGSSLHQIVAPPPDLAAAADHSADRKGRAGKGSKDGKGYTRSRSSNGGDGYEVYDTFQKKDGDKFGYEKHFTFGNKGAGGKDGEYAHSSSYDTGDEAGTNVKPKFTAYHFEKKSGSPTKKRSHEDDGSVETKLTPEAVSPDFPDDVEVTGPISGPKFQSLGDRSGQYRSRPPRKVLHNKKRSKEPQAAATEGDYYYDYSNDGEEDDGGGEYDGEYSSGESDYY